MRRFVRVLAVLIAAVALPALVAAASIPTALGQVYPPRPPGAWPAPAPRTLDPGLPTVAVVLAPGGTNVADSLAPYEVLARSGAVNVVLAASSRAPVPLTGGVDVLPEVTFDDLAALPRAPDAIVVPALIGDVRPELEWVAAQHAAGSVVMSVCVGAGHLAHAGLLAGRPATSNWLGLIGLRRSHPEVAWVDGERFVDDGDIITTGAVLSGIDGSLRLVERLVGPDAAARVADEIHWAGYRPGSPTAIPVARAAPQDLVGLLSAAYRWDRPSTGVLLTEGIGEIEVAAAFRPTTELSYLARPWSLTLDGAPVRSRHGLTLLPRGAWPDAAGRVARVVVPGTGPAVDAAAATAASGRPSGGGGVEVVRPMRAGEFAFDGALRDIALHDDVASAAWVAKSLQFAAPRLDGLGGRTGLAEVLAAWPWGLSARAVLLAALGALLGVLAVRAASRAGSRAGARPGPGAGSRPAPPAGS